MVLELPHDALSSDGGRFRMSRYSKLEELLENARAKRDQLRTQLASIESAILQFEELQRSIPPDLFEDLINRTPNPAIDPPPEALTTKKDTLLPDAVATRARDLLLAEQRPMKRGQIVRALLAQGTPLAGADKNKNLGTILWRHPRMFVTIEGMGYWVKGVPLEGIYDPERDDEPMPKTTFVPRRQA